MILHFKEITDVLEKHLKDPKNILGFMMEKFTDWFNRTYGKVLQEKSLIDRSTFKKLTQSAIDQIKSFIQIIVDNFVNLLKIEEK